MVYSFFLNNALLVLEKILSSENDMRFNWIKKTFLSVFIVISMLLLTACPSTESSREKKSENQTPEQTTEITVSESDEPSATITSIESSETTSITSQTSHSEETSISESETEEMKIVFEETSSEESSSDPSESEEPGVPVVEKGFVVHYIDVGQGDASLIICDEEAMLIDGGKPERSDLIYTYLKQHDITHLKYIVGTHPDDDHIGGLAGALNFATAERAFCSVDEYDSRAFSSFQKYLNQQKVTLEIPQAGSEVTLGSAKVKFLAPRTKLSDTNNNSIVIRVIYGQTSFLFTGDAEFDEENTILNGVSKSDVSSSVLKVAHHGSEYSTSDKFLKTVDPSLAIISCGKDNQYGFPKQKVLDLMKDNGVEVLRTDLQGDILVYSDGENITYETEKQTTEDLYLAPGITDPEPEGENDCSFVANMNTHKFHKPGCSSVKKMKESNKWYFDGTREELIAQGYEPCKNCKP